MTDEIPRLVRRLIESDDIDEVRSLREQLNAIIRQRMNEIRSRAAELSKRTEIENRKQRA